MGGRDGKTKIQKTKRDIGISGGRKERRKDKTKRLDLGGKPKVEGPHTESQGTQRESSKSAAGRGQIYSTAPSDWPHCFHPGPAQACSLLHGSRRRAALPVQATAETSALPWVMVPPTGMHSVPRRATAQGWDLADPRQMHRPSSIQCHSSKHSTAPPPPIPMPQDSDSWTQLIEI